MLEEHKDGPPMIRREGWGIMHRDLVCEPLHMEYDFVQRRGRLWMADGDCCDMDGCIRMFAALDQDVTLIEAWSGDKADISYVRTADGSWQAMNRR